MYGYDVKEIDESHGTDITEPGRKGVLAIAGPLPPGCMQPVWRDGQWTPRLLLPLSLSYDHRVIDGANAARFCRALAEMLENPLEMVVHV